MPTTTTNPHPCIHSSIFAHVKVKTAPLPFLTGENHISGPLTPIHHNSCPHKITYGRIKISFLPCLEVGASLVKANVQKSKPTSDFS
jgi:hypothetical protein